MTQRRHFLGSAVALAASSGLPLLHSQTAFAQNFPSRTIRYICPWNAGGTTDIVMREFADVVETTSKRLPATRFAIIYSLSKQSKISDTT